MLELERWAILITISSPLFIDREEYDESMTSFDCLAAE
jgi:hypothetical protein